MRAFYFKMNIKIYLDVAVKNKEKLPIITFKKNTFDYTQNQYIEIDLDYPLENTVTFNANNIELESANINIVKIELNSMPVNSFYNTSFEMRGNRWVTEEILTSISNITFNGIFKLDIDDLYVRSHRSNNWHCSPQKEDFVFQYEFTRSSFTDAYRDRNHTGFNKEFIPCFGCSFTYGAYQPDTDTWPYLLSQRTGKNFINLGVGGLGIDGIYNNLKLLYQKHKFNQCVILFPNFERRLVRCKIEELYFTIPSTVDIHTANSDYQFYNNQNVQKKMSQVKEKIIKDVENRYSKKILTKILNFCADNAIKLYCSSWSNDEYNHLKQLKVYNNLKLLPKFPELSMFKERADDGWHPHKKHYQYFVDQLDL